MFKPASILSTLFLIAASCLPGVAVTPSGTSSAIVVPSEMPLTFVSAVVDSEMGRHLTVLNYSVKNASNGVIKQFTVGAYLVGSNSKCLSGEGWTIKKNVPPNATRKFSITLRNYVDLGTRLAVAVISAGDETGSMKMDPAQLRQALRQISAADLIANSTPSLDVVTAASGAPLPGACDPAFCTTARTDALAICLGENCQLSTFTCSQSACSYSFACRCCQGGHCT